MELLPEQRLDVIVRRHGAALGLIHGYLDLAVAKAFSLLGPVCRPKDLRGATLGGVVRQLVLVSSVNPVMKAASLSLVERPNVGLRLVDGSDLQIRVRKWPLGRLGLAPLPVTDPPVETLFGPDWSACPYEFVVLWSADVGGRCLGSAVLAAVADLDAPHRTAIYAKVPLPLATASTVSPSAAPAVDDDFEDEWPDAEEDTGPDPA